MPRPSRLIAATLLSAMSLLAAAAPLEIVRVTPSGEDVPVARQILFQFDRAVVLLGRMARHAHEIPARIQPRVHCRWRWIDVSALACDLPAGETLAPATRYVVLMDPGIVALDGARLTQSARHEFITERPRVDRVDFETWLTPTTPVLRVNFNQPVTRDGVRANLRFAPLDPDRAPLAVRVAADHEDGLTTLAGAASPAQIAHAALLASTPSRSWLLAPVGELPGDARIALNVQPGVVGEGPQPGIEARATVSFDTFPEFAFLGIACSDVSSGRRIELAPRASTPGPGPCDPLAGVALLFSSPVRAPQIAAAMRLEPALAGAHDGRDAWRDVRDHVSLQAPHTRGRAYAVWLPQRLEAYRGYHITGSPDALRDAFERPLEAGMDMRFGTAHRRARLHLSHPAAVLEQGLDSDVPVYVTNLEAIDLVYRHSASIGTHARRLTVPKVPDLSFALPLGVRDILAGGSGVVSGTLAPVPSDADQDQSHFFAQVTPFAITVKLGHFSTIAWVTRLDDGKPVVGAALTLYIDRLDTLTGPGGGAIGPFITGANGIARLPGSAVLDPDLKLLEIWERPASRLFLRVAKDGELGVLPLDNDFRVWTREVWPQRQRAFGHLKAWGTTAQGIYRGGDRLRVHTSASLHAGGPYTAAPARVTVRVAPRLLRLDVTVTPQRTLYRPRDTARIDFQVRARDSGAVAREPVQLAVAVLDEAVFDLVAGGSRNFDPYTGFYALDGLDVVSYSLLTRLVGRQKFEQKGASSGGDGGQATGLRDLFRFVSYWNPSVAVDTSGHASIEFGVPDNLTGWRVLALAVTPGDRMGLDEGSFAVNKDTELRPVMPNQISARDRFRAGFSVLNRSAATRTLHVEINASAQVAIAAFARQSVWLDVATARAGEVRLHARAADAQDSDSLEHAIPVRSPTRLITAATHGSITHGVVDQHIEIPAGIDTSVGDITLLASPSIVATAAGALRHMRDYPYACWEQRLSRAVMASRFAALRDYLPPDLEWPEHASLAQQTLSDAARFQAPGGGMAFWLAQDARTNPYLSAYTALAFAWLAADGHRVPQTVRERLHAHLGEMLRRDVLPDFYSRGMASSVRAVALAALAQRGDVSAADVRRYRDHLPHMSVFAKAMYLDAAWRTDPRQPLVGEVLASLIAHGEERGGSFALAERVQAEGQHLLDTPARANCAALATLSRLAADPALEPTLTPLAAKLARSVTQSRARRDHWDNTQENVFCTSALLDYARTFERSAPALQLRASLDADAMGEVRFASPRDAAVTLVHELTEADAGQHRVLRIEHQGTGRAYYSARLRHAPSADSARRTSAGMSLRREYSVQRDGEWQLLVSPVTLRRGELVRVDLYLTLPAARHFVVVDDPVPGADPRGATAGQARFHAPARAHARRCDPQPQLRKFVEQSRSSGLA